MEKVKRSVVAKYFGRWRDEQVEHRIFRAVKILCVRSKGLH